MNYNENNALLITNINFNFGYDGIRRKSVASSQQNWRKK